MATSKQIGMIRGLLAKAGLTDLKEDLVWEYSGGATVSLTAMAAQPTNQLIKFLLKVNNQDENPAVKMRRKIMSMAHEMRWEHPDGRVNMTRLNNWCIAHSGQNKPLDEFKLTELPKLVSQFEIVYTGFLKGI